MTKDNTPSGDVLSKLDFLAILCKSSVHVTYNEHTTNYESIEEYLSRDYMDCSNEDRKSCVKAGRVIEVQFYPLTPIGFYKLLGPELEPLLDEAIEIAREEVKS